MLIQTNHDLQQPEAARGVLKLGKQLDLVSDDDLEIKEKSQEWQELLNRISLSEIPVSQKIEYQNKRLNCYSKLMSWQDLSNLVSEIYEGFHNEFDYEKKSIIRD